MASIRKRFTPRGRVVYDVMWREKSDGRWVQRREAQPDWNTARARKAEVEHGLMVGGRRTVKGRSKATVAEVVIVASRARTQRRSTRGTVKSFVDNHLAGTPLGEMRLADVTHDDVQTWLTALVTPVHEGGHGLAPSTALKGLKYVRTGLNRAVRLGELPACPIHDGELHRPAIDSNPEAEVVPLTRNQINSLVEGMRLAANPILANAVIAQVGLGLRIGELLGMRVGDIVDVVADGERGPVLRLRRQWAQRGALAELKTRRSARDVPVPAFVVTAVEDQVRTYGLRDGDFLWSWRAAAGAPYSHEGYRGAFGEALAAAGLDQVRPKVTTHTLRHTYVSWLMEQGATIAEIARWVGDTEAVVTATYSHLMPTASGRARTALDSMWAAGPDPRVASILHGAPPVGG